MKRTILITALLFLSAVRAAGETRWGSNHPGADWQVILTDHFRVLHPTASAAAAARAASIAEDAYLPVSEIVGAAPPKRIDILLTDWEDRSGGRAWSASPRIEIEAYLLDRESATVDFLRQVVAHEFTHICMYYAVGGGRFGFSRTSLALQNLPDWWVEGIASALEKPEAEPREVDLLRVIARTGELPRMRRLDNVDQGDRLDNHLVYRIGESKVRWMVGRFGRGVIAAVHKAMLPIPWSFDHALRSATGMGENEIHEAWRSDLLDVLQECGDLVKPLGEVPLPNKLERPISFSYSVNGDLAVVAVRDEDTWWQELYLRKRGEENMALVESGPVWRDVTWSPGGGRLVYSLLTPGCSNEDQYDLFLFDLRTGLKRRLTEGMRAIAPRYGTDGIRVYAAAYDRESGGSALIVVNTLSGEVERHVMSRNVLLFEPASGDETILSTLAPRAHRQLLHFDEETSRFAPPDREGTRDAYDPFHRRGLGLYWITYRSGYPFLAQPDRSAPEGVSYIPLPEGTRNPSLTPEGRICAVTTSKRYGSEISFLDLTGSPAKHPFPEIPWHAEPILTLPAAGRSSGFDPPTLPYRSAMEIRPRPDASINSINTDCVEFTIDNILTDPVEKHNFSLDGRFSYDMDEKSAVLTYRNTQLLPTIYIRGGYGEALGHGLKETGKSAALIASLPFRGDSYSIRKSFDAELYHSRFFHKEDGLAETQSRETLLRLALVRSVNRPRRQSLFALHYERGVDLWYSDMLPERWSAEGGIANAFIRNDWFLSFTGRATIETSGEKREITLYPYNIHKPSHTASGTAAAVWGAGISFPWSEDLHLAAGPFYFERLTQRIRFREGDAWDRKHTGAVRSFSAEIDLNVFSGHFIPFFSARSAHLIVGAAIEPASGASPEFYFAIDSNFWQERWHGERAIDGDRGRRAGVRCATPLHPCP